MSGEAVRTPARDGGRSYRPLALARVDAEVARVTRLLREAPFPAGLSAEIARAAHEAVAQVLPAGARPALVISDGERSFGMPRDAVAISTDCGHGPEGFEVRRGRNGARVVRTGATPVMRNGWPLLAARPAALFDGDTIAAAGSSWVARYERGRVRPIVEVGPARVSSAPATAPFLYGFSLVPAGAPVALALDGPTARAVVEVVLGGDGSRPFDPTAMGEVESGVVRWVAHRVAHRAAEAIFGGRASLSPCEIELPTPTIWLAAPARVGAYSGAAWVGASEAAVRAASALLEPIARTSRFASPAVARVELWIAAVVPLGAVSPRDLCCMEPGDVLLCRSVRAGCSPELRATGFLTVRGAEPFAVRAALERSDGVLRARLLASSAFPNGGEAMDATNCGDARGDTEPPFEPVLDALAVAVSVEIARRRMSLGELLALSPGDVVELNAPVSAAVTLTVDGVPLARGELVDVEGSLGVRVLAIGGRR